MLQKMKMWLEILRWRWYPGLSGRAFRITRVLIDEEARVQPQEKWGQKEGAEDTVAGLEEEGRDHELFLGFIVYFGLLWGLAAASL